MRIWEIVWLDAVVDKLAFKHGVETEEVEEFSKVARDSGSLKKDAGEVKMCTWRVVRPTPGVI